MSYSTNYFSNFKNQDVSQSKKKVEDILDSVSEQVNSVIAPYENKSYLDTVVVFDQVKIQYRIYFTFQFYYSKEENSSFELDKNHRRLFQLDISCPIEKIDFDSQNARIISFGSPSVDIKVKSILNTEVLNNVEKIFLPPIEYGSFKTMSDYFNHFFGDYFPNHKFPNWHDMSLLISHENKEKKFIAHKSAFSKLKQQLLPVWNKNFANNPHVHKYLNTKLLNSFLEKKLPQSEQSSSFKKI